MGKELQIPNGEDNAIREVTVFLDQAYARREARARVEAGLTRILMEVTAFRLDRESLQAQVFGKGQLLSVQYREVPVKDAPQESVRELDERKRELQHHLKHLEQARAVVDKQTRFLDSTLEYAEVQVPREIKTLFPKVGEMGQMLDFMDSRYQGLSRRSEDLDKETEELADELAVVERRLKKAQRGRNSQFKAIEVLFESGDAQEIRILASYTVDQARWTPTYKVEVAERLDRVQLTQFAEITQNTGEDWNEVALTVSNAAPTKGTHLPKPTSWLLRKQPVYPSTGDLMVGAVAAAPAEAEFGEAAGAGAEPEALVDILSEPAAEFVTAEQTETPISFEYRLPRNVDIGSDGDETLLPLLSKPIEGEFFHHIVPRFDPHAYLVCSIPSDRELLPGQLNIHFAGRYVASTRLSTGLAGEDMLLNLGVDRSVLVKREPVIDRLTETFFSVVERSHVARELVYRIQVENLGEDEIHAKVYDSVPVSETDRFQVKGLELTPEPDQRDWNERLGVMCWELDIPARQSDSIRMHFFVKYPRKERPEGF